MDIQIQTIHFDADEKLLDFTKKKIGKLTQYFDHIVSADVYFKLENNHTDVKDKIVELKLNIPGNTLYISETHKTFEEGVDQAVEGMSRQLKKYKEKLKS